MHLYADYQAEAISALDLPERLESILANGMRILKTGDLCACTTKALTIHRIKEQGLTDIQNALKPRNLTLLDDGGHSHAAYCLALGVFGDEWCTGVRAWQPSRAFRIKAFIMKAAKAQATLFEQEFLTTFYQPTGDWARIAQKKRELAALLRANGYGYKTDLTEVRQRVLIASRSYITPIQQETLLQQLELVGWTDLNFLAPPS